MAKINKIIRGVPSSFVFKNMKLEADKGAGEAKLFVGPKSQITEINDFFKFNQGYSYRFDKINLLNYLHEVKMEYVFQYVNRYKNASIETWQDLYNSIENMQDSEMKIHLTEYDDASRVYVRAEEEIFSKLFRKIIVPKLTDIEFVRDDDAREILVLLKVNYDYDIDKNDISAETDITEEINFTTGFESAFSRNRILFGAPGTGKSFSINQDAKSLIGNENNDDYERVTFHPDYSYANFVGTYKPVPTVDSSGKDAITYEYVPGPFMRIYVKALKNSRTDTIKPFLLIVEEINRANVAAVFGDIFQLLDRGDDFVSEYHIQASEDIKKYLANEFGGNPNDYNRIKIPDNMFIWATMNSADQGVFPMDTAFKRRWDFIYLGIDDSDVNIQGKYVELGKGKNKKIIEWNSLRKSINDFLAEQNINEDKQLGPYFLKKDIIIPKTGDEIDKDKFINAFKSKVIMYLFDDAAKQKRKTLFEGCDEGNRTRYSSICKEFDDKGIYIFNSSIINKVTFKPTPSQFTQQNTSDPDNGDLLNTDNNDFDLPGNEAK